MARLDIGEDHYPKKKGGNKGPDGAVIRDRRPLRQATGVSLSVGDRTLGALSSQVVPLEPLAAE